MAQKVAVEGDYEKIPIQEETLGANLKGTFSISKLSNNDVKSYGSTSTQNSDSGASVCKRRRGDRQVTKDGRLNYSARNSEHRHLNFYFTDFFTTLMEIKWRWTLFFFCFSFFGSWVLFACGWWLILYFHGDFQHYGVEGWVPCISNIHNWATAFLFSVETQTTIGYGFYELRDECPDAVILYCLQAIFGVILEGLMVGILFVKMIRAKRRSATIVFSQNAVICHRDGQRYFMFRVADLRNAQHLVEAHIRAQLIRKRVTLEGELVNWSQEEFDVNGDGEKEDKLLLWWPTVVVHKINEDSPLYNLTPTELQNSKGMFEVIVVLEGIVESTGLTMQMRSSYIPSEIIWGQRFVPLASSKAKDGSRIIDFSQFHCTLPEQIESL